MSRFQKSILLSPWHHALWLPRDAGTSSEPGSIFQNAIMSFRDALCDEDKLHLKPFENASDMTRDLVEHCKNSTESSRLLVACEPIDKFVQRWEPFSEVVRIFVHSNPEWPAVAWGAVRLVFLVCFPSSMNVPGIW